MAAIHKKLENRIVGKDSNLWRITSNSFYKINSIYILSILRSYRVQYTERLMYDSMLLVEKSLVLLP
jgi:hypothetical protein